MNKLLTIFTFLTISSSFPLRKLESSSSPVYTNHVILFSHMDLGWIYTIDQYYKGTNSAAGGCVSCIFRNVLNSLNKESATKEGRTYLIAEVGFFEMWWTKSSEDDQKSFKKILAEGKVEFVNGGWSSNDEACAYYEDIVDNFIVGLRWLKQNLQV